MRVFITLLLGKKGSKGVSICDHSYQKNNPPSRSNLSSEITSEMISSLKDRLIASNIGHRTVSRNCSQLGRENHTVRNHGPQGVEDLCTRNPGYHFHRECRRLARSQRLHNRFVWARI